MVPIDDSCGIKSVSGVVLAGYAFKHKDQCAYCGLLADGNAVAVEMMPPALCAAPGNSTAKKYQPDRFFSTAATGASDAGNRYRKACTVGVA